MTSTVAQPEIIQQLRSITTSSLNSEVERQQALREAYSLVSRLETPLETSRRRCTLNPISLICVKIALDLNLLQGWISEYDGKPCSAKQLQELVPQCDPTLFMRVFHQLVSTGDIQQQRHDSQEPLYEMTPYIRAQVENDFASQTELACLWGVPILLSLPRYFEKIRYANPQNALIDPVKDFTGGLSVWEYLQNNEGWSDVFGRFMKASAKLRGDITGHLEGLQLTCDQDDSVLLVDIGGSIGHDLISFRQRYKEARGRLILQELPHVIKSAPSLDNHGIEKMSYDFFTPQPVKGAKAYLLHDILHNWPDKEVKRILENVAASMDKDHSKLLILEMVVREEKPTIRETSYDWLMITYGNGMESKSTALIISLDTY